MNMTYTRTAIALHWMMAAALILMLGSGFFLAFDLIPNEMKPTTYHWHKSSGVLLLLAVSLRILWRMLHKPPFLSGFERWEVVLSQLGHYGLYLCMLVMPVSGWIMSSARLNSTGIDVFNWFTLPPLSFMAGETALGGFARTLHGYAAYGFVLLIALHVAAVIKHELIDKRPILYRMWRS